jgi:hypothetical protein
MGRVSSAEGWWTSKLLGEKWVSVDLDFQMIFNDFQMGKEDAVGKESGE